MKRIAILFIVGTSLAEQPHVWMNVFIHGAIKASWARCSLLKVMRGAAEQSTYATAVAQVRNDSLFYPVHAMQDMGLKKIDMTAKNISGAHAIAHAYDQITALNQPHPTANYYYTFGWSGLCSRSIRYEEGKMLYDSLCEELLQLQTKEHLTPHIRLICYSHGGNVCLSMAEVKRKEPQLACLKIDEVILLGMPVVQETDHLTNDEMFKKIYHLYSPDDMVQANDFLSFKRWFSNRRFRPHNGFTLPEKLTQISVQVAMYEPRKRSITLPQPIPTDYTHGLKKKSMNPGHTELWYLGWAPAWYREKFPLNPLPIAVFSSYLIQEVHNATQSSGDVKKFYGSRAQPWWEVTLQPQWERLQIRNKHDAKHALITRPFVPVHQLKILNKQIESFKPSATYYAESKRRSHEALFFARHEKNGAIVCMKGHHHRRCKRTFKPMCLA